MDETKVTKEEKAEITGSRQAKNWVEGAEDWLDNFLDTIQVENNGRNQSN